MKLLLTSGGIKNQTIHGALAGLLRKPIAECNALFIPTAKYGHPACTPAFGLVRLHGQHVHCGLEVGGDARADCTDRHR